MRLADGSYKYSTVLTHQGTVIAFASHATAASPGTYHIGYSVLKLTPVNPDDDGSWGDFELLDLSHELRPVGMSLVTVDFKDADIPVADVPFQVLSDGSYVYLFRQSSSGTLLMDRYVYDEVLGRLARAWEVRYRRSRKIDIPLDQKDTFGSTDMEGEYFTEPTMELSMVTGLSNGWFSVLILPTELPGIERWQIFACNAGVMNCFSIPRSENGLFDLVDVLHNEQVPPAFSFSLTTGGGTPSPLAFASAPATLLYMQQERLKDDSGRPQLLKREARVMMAVGAGTTGQTAIVDFGVSRSGTLPNPGTTVPVPPAPTPATGLQLDGRLGTSASLPALSGVTAAATVEAWVYPGAGTGTGNILASAANAAVPLSLSVTGGVPTFSAGSGAGAKTVSAPALEAQVWSHLAGTWDGTTATLYLNGQPFTTAGTAPTRPAVSAGYLLGGTGGFGGTVDELRIWNACLSRAQILSSMCTPVNSGNPQWSSLQGYWPMDAPAGTARLTTVPNASSLGTAANGTLNGAQWVPSNAPVGPSMAPVAWDATGLNVVGTLLTYTTAGGAPSLLSGSDSLLHLYFRDSATAQTFEAAHYGTEVARAAYAVGWTAPGSGNNPAQSGTLRFVARLAGTGMNDPQVSPAFVDIVADPVNAGYLQVTLRAYTGLTEVWPRVPPELFSFAEVLNGEALQTTTDPVAVQRGDLMYDYTRVVVTPGGGEYESQPKQGTGSGIFSAMPDHGSDNGNPASVQTTAAVPPVLVRAGVDGWWVPDSPAASLTMPEAGNFVQVLSSSTIGQAGALSLPGSLCVEAWVNPSANSADQQSTLVLFNGGAAPAPRYLLALDQTGHPFAGNASQAQAATAAVPLNAWTHLAASYRSDYGIKLTGARYLDAGNSDTLSTADAVTLEAWVRVDTAGGVQTVASKTGEDAGTSWKLYLDGSGVPRFDVTVDTQLATAVRSVASTGALAPGSWHHLAAVYDVAYKQATAVQFKNGTGSFVSIPTLTTPPVDAVSVEAWVKPQTGGNTAGSQVILQSVSQGSVILNLQLTAGGKPYFQVIVGASSPSIQSTAALPVDHWSHLAGTYDANGINLYVDGLPVPTSTKLAEGAAEDAAEAPAAAAAEEGPAGVTGGAADYSVGGYAGQNTFNGLINELRLWNRRLSLDEIRMYINRPLTGGERGLVGYWPFNDRFGTTATDLAGTSGGTLSGGAVFVQDHKGAFMQKILVDGVRTVWQTVNDPPHLTDARVRMGSGAFADYLHATIDDVRLWKSGRMDWEIGYYMTQPLPQDSEGLVSEWTFDTGSGRVAFDSKSDNNALILDASTRLTDEAADAMWVPTFFRPGWTLYVNGAQATSAAYTPPLGFGGPQLSIGATLAGVGGAGFFTGTLAEVRVWSTQRTAEQIRDNMNRPLTGAEEGLAGYWPMRDGSGGQVGDYSGLGHSGTWLGFSDPGWAISTAPVDEEGPQVMSVPGGATRTSYAGAGGTPAAAEYGDTQVSATGVLYAVMKRCYVYTDLTAGLNLVTGYKVGDLDMQYVGQVQTRPTLIGYIEGAPPLPSENLTVDSPITPYKYLASSTVTLTEADNTVQSYTASRDTGTDDAMDYKLGLSVGLGLSAGVWFQYEIVKAEISAGFHMALDTTTSWLNEAQVGSTVTATTEKTIEVFGAWVNNTQFAANLGPRLYFPNNKGYALVRSGTADLYALRLKGTGSFVAYSVRPDPDVPEDVNIIMFAIDPHYVKNGTLDGWVGYQPDPVYGNLQPGEKRSYFKPLEAYALKRQIERQYEQLRTVYDQFQAAELGQRESNRLGADIGKTGTNLQNVLLGLKDNASRSNEEWKALVARRNLVNTYVWNSDGGLYSEQEEFAAVREESSGGAYDVVTKFGFYAEVNMNIGVDESLDALFGSHIRTRAMKVRSEGTQFGLACTAPGEGFLNLREDGGGTAPPGQYPVLYKDQGCPGKVNQYRFMSFYLAPRKKNFEDFKAVVDQRWLNRQPPYTDPDPDAFALREALANPNEVWRVLHRVTYVNRLLPPTGDDGESIPPPVRRPDADSVVANAWMIADLPVNPDDPQIMAVISGELDTLLATMQQNPLWGARLDVPATKQDVMIWMRGFYAVS